MAKLLRAIAPLTLPLLFASCSANTNGDTTSTLLTVTNVQGIAGLAATQGDELFADVCDNQGAANPNCTVANDSVQVSLTSRPKDQLRSFGQFNDVTFNRYRVTYVRADGRNTPGVDVPYAFDGSTNFTVSINGTASKSMTVVTQQAKLSPPLSNLRFGGGAIVFSAIAQVDLYGNDAAGRPTTVRALLNVTFGDF